MRQHGECRVGKVAPAIWPRERAAPSSNPRGRSSELPYLRQHTCHDATTRPLSWKSSRPQTRSALLWSFDLARDTFRILIDIDDSASPALSVCNLHSPPECCQLSTPLRPPLRQATMASHFNNQSQDEPGSYASLPGLGSRGFVSHNMTDVKSRATSLKEPGQ